MGQALHKARGAVTRFSQASRAPAQESIAGSSSSSSQEPPEEIRKTLRYVSVGLKKPKTPEQLGREARWAEEARIRYSQPKKVPNLKTRLREQEAKMTDYQPEPPYDQPPPFAEEGINREWDQSDPTYKFMTHKAASNVATRTTNLTDEAAKAAAAAQMMRPKPLSRSKVSQDDIDGRIVPGKLNILQLKEAYLLYHGKAQGEVKQLDVEAIAQRFEVKPELLKQLFQYTSLAEGKPVDKEIFKGTPAFNRR